MRTIQEMFRNVFVNWGLPDRVRVDNGYPWGTSRDLPSELALWLIGLGVEPIWNPPGQPTRNPKVERFNGLTQQWGELHTCTDCQQAVKVLAWVGRIQREEYPAIRGRTRMEAFPQLRTPRRVYRRAHEKAKTGISPEWTPSQPGGAGSGRPIAMERSRSTGTAERSVGLGLARKWWCGSMRPHGVGWSPIKTGTWSSSCQRRN